MALPLQLEVMALSGFSAEFGGLVVSDLKLVFSFFFPNFFFPLFFYLYPSLPPSLHPSLPSSCLPVLSQALMYSTLVSNSLCRPELLISTSDCSTYSMYHHAWFISDLKLYLHLHKY